MGLYPVEGQLIISRMSAKNFRSVADSSINLKPLTVLAGPNASGKSNVLDIARFLGDAVRTNLDAALSVRYGIGGVRRRQRGGRPRNVEIGVQCRTRRFTIDYKFALAGAANGGYQVAQEGIQLRGRTRLDPQLDVDVRNGKVVSLNSPYLDQILLDDDDAEFETDNLALPAIRRFLNQRRGRNAREDTDRAFSASIYSMQRTLAQMRVYHIFPNTMREPQKVSQPYPLAEDGGNLASALKTLDKDHPNIMARLKESLRLLIPSVIDLRVVSAGGFLVTQLRHAESNNRASWFDLTQESDGTLRLLGILTALYQHPPLPFIGIEEPELTIHPGAMAALTDVMKEAARRSQIVMTTHSPDVLDQFHVDNILAVDSNLGITSVGRVSNAQVKSVRQNLFTLGELHSMEGLKPAGRTR